MKKIKGYPTNPSCPLDITIEVGTYPVKVVDLLGDKYNIRTPYLAIFAGREGRDILLSPSQVEDLIKLLSETLKEIY